MLNFSNKPNYRVIPKSTRHTRNSVRHNDIRAGGAQVFRTTHGIETPALLTEGRGDPNLDISLESIGSEEGNPPSQDLSTFLTTYNEIRLTFGSDTVSKIRRLQKADFRAKKSILDKSYLQHCIELRLFPSWLTIKVGNLGHRGQQKLICSYKLQTLKNELTQKKNRARECFRIKNTLERELCDTIGPQTANQWLSKLVEQNSSRLHKAEVKQFRKMSKLLLDNNKIDKETFITMRKKGQTEIGEDLEVIFNLSTHVLSEDEKTGLKNGLKFIPTPKKIDEVELYANLEAVVGSIYYAEKNPPQLSDLASALSREAQNAVERFYHNRPLQNLPKKVGLALQALAKRKDLVITKPDKGNGVVLLDKADYVTKMGCILDDQTKFRKVQNVDLYKSTISLETQVRFSLQKLLNANIIDKFSYQKAYPKGSRPCLLYGLPKIHKNGAPLRPILSAIGSAAHGLAQILVPLLSPITHNQYTVSNSFLFSEELRESNSGKLILASFDISSLFTNIPLTETVDIILKANRDGKLAKKTKPGHPRTCAKSHHKELRLFLQRRKLHTG